MPSNEEKHHMHQSKSEHPVQELSEKDDSSNTEPVDTLPEGALRLPSLPLDVIVLVAQALISKGLYRTCAAFSISRKDVREEILSILWKHHISLLAYALELVGPPVASDALRMPSADVLSRMEIVRAQWDRLLTSEGAKQIEFLGVPVLALDAARCRAYAACVVRPGATGLFPRLKASIAVNKPEYMVLVPNNSALAIAINESYTTGSSDILGLAQALSALNADSGFDGRKMLQNPGSSGFAVTVVGKRTNALRFVGDHVLRITKELRAMRGFRPMSFMMLLKRTDYEPQELAPVWLELALWVEERKRADMRARGLVKSAVHADFTRRDYVIACCKLFGKAIQAYPRLSHLDAAFRIKVDNCGTTELSDNLKTFHTIFRAIYLHAAQYVPLECIGIASVHVLASNWMQLHVQADPCTNSIVTALDTESGTKVLHRDPAPSR